MKNFKKLCIFLLAFSLVLPIFSNIKAKADTSFSLENMSEDEIVDLIFNSCKDIYPKEGQTIEEYANYIEKRLPFAVNSQIESFKKSRWATDYGKYCDFCYDTSYNRVTINKINKFMIYMGKYAEAMDGSYHLSDKDTQSKYIEIGFTIDNNYKKASNIYDKIVKKLNLYYNNGTDRKDITTNEWEYSIQNEFITGYDSEQLTYVQSYDGGYYLVMFRLTKYSDSYYFNLCLINPNYLSNPGPLAKSMLDEPNEISFSDDEDEFSFDDEIELDDPVLKSITNKKGKKLVVKYTGDDSFDNEIYKIQISTNKNFKSSKEFETKKTSATISKLKKGKTYYVRIMYTVTEDGETVSSNWSKTKSIKIKK